MPAESTTNQQVQTTYTYAGIGTRFIAYFIDSIIMSIPTGIFAVVMAIVIGTAAENADGQGQLREGGVIAIFSALCIGYIILFVMLWLYYALMESSAKQATIGKRVMGLKVTDMAGNRISFGKASARFFVKTFLSGFLAIGYIMVFFTEKKQGLHDVIPGTLVVQKA